MLDWSDTKPAPLHPAFAPHASDATGLGAIARGAARVAMDEKRTINARADVNQPLPLKYAWAWEKYLSGCNNHWMPTEVSMQAGIALWKSRDGLTEDERRMLKRNLVGVARVDEGVEPFHLRARGLDGDHIGIHRGDRGEPGGNPSIMHLGRHPAGLRTRRWG